MSLSQKAENLTSNASMKRTDFYSEEKTLVENK